LSEPLFVAQRQVITATIASVAVFGYDYILTVGDEIEYIWSSKWGAGKFLFLLARYSVIVDSSLLLYFLLSGNLSAPACKSLFYSLAYLQWVGTSFAETILGCRTWAVWERSKRVLGILTVAFVVSFIVGMIFIHKYLISLRFTQLSRTPYQMAGCFHTGGTTDLFITFAAVLFLETVIFLTTIVRGFQQVRQFKTSGLVRGLYLNGSLYYGYVLIMSVINMIIMTVEPFDRTDLLIAMQRVFHSVFATRILLQLRKWVHQEEMHPTFNLPEASMQFNEQCTSELDTALSSTLPPPSAEEGLFADEWVFTVTR